MKEPSRGRKSDVIYVSREATYTLMKHYSCPNCSAKIYALYDIKSKSITVGCRSCMHTVTTQTDSSLRSYLIAQLGEERVGFILNDKLVDEKPASIEQDPVSKEEPAQSTDNLLTDIDGLLDNLTD